MITKEVLEIAFGMEVTSETKEKIAKILVAYKPVEEVEEKVFDQIMKLIDADFDPIAVVEDADTIVKF